VTVDDVRLGRALALGTVSHLVLDLATHARDIPLWPGSRYDLGLAPQLILIRSSFARLRTSLDKLEEQGRIRRSHLVSLEEYGG
jgi:hypothetical protein